VPLWLAPKLALYLAMRDQQVNNSELARRLGVHERVIRRLLDPEHASKAEKIQAALAALGKQMTVEVRDAAEGPGRGEFAEFLSPPFPRRRRSRISSQPCPVARLWTLTASASCRFCGDAGPTCGIYVPYRATACKLA
jgi:hypothetical protein